MMRLVLSLVVLSTFLAEPAAAQSLPPQQTSIEFLFTSQSVISLRFLTVEIRPGTILDLTRLQSELPGYKITSGMEEGRYVWYVFSRIDANGQSQGGVSIYMDGGQPSKIDAIVGSVGVIDAVGATASKPLSAVLSHKTAKCSLGLDFTCNSDIPNLDYMISLERCPSTVSIFDYLGQHKETPVNDCMLVEGIWLHLP